jgi:hypothetical protein
MGRYLLNHGFILAQYHNKELPIKSFDQNSRILAKSAKDNSDLNITKQLKSESLARKSTCSGIAISRSLPKKSEDSQTGPTTSNVVLFAPAAGGDTNSMCCTQYNQNMSKNKRQESAVLQNLKMSSIKNVFQEKKKFLMPHNHLMIHTHSLSN